MIGLVHLFWYNILGFVTLYEHAGFNGKSQTFAVGSHDMDVLTIIGNDSVSSLKVHNGHKVSLFEHAGFEGKKVVFGPGEHDFGALTGSGFENDTLSSLVVETTRGMFRFII